MAGFREHEHTADWELEAWADDLPGLLEQAARGMYVLSGARLQTGPRQQRRFQVQAEDLESLLVRFLSELLYFSQQEGLGFDYYQLALQDPAAGIVLQAQVEGAALASIDKEIKAVTYHNLVVRQAAGELRVRVVFDV